MRVDVLTTLVHCTYAIGITIRREAEHCTAAPNLIRQRSEILRHGLRIDSAKEDPDHP